MIQEFSFKNYLSIKETQSLSFVPRRSDLNNELFTAEVVPGVRLLKSAMIYGANASGKTNILKAINFLRDIVIETRRRGEKTGFIPFKFDDDTVNSPGEFEIIFYQNQNKFRYYLKITATEIIEEELNYYKTQNPAKIFYRKMISKQEIHIEYSKEFGVNKAEAEMIRARVLPNVSVLSTLGEVSPKKEYILRAYNWFFKELNPFITPETELKGCTSGMIFDDENVKKLMTIMMRKADFNIDSIFEEEEIELNGNNSVNRPYALNFVKDNKLFVRSVNFSHSILVGNEKKSFNLDDELESKGTWRYFGLAGTLLEILHGNKVLFIDEIDSSIHPDLLNYFYSMFLVNSKRAQLIFTIHSRDLLADKELSRRDSIWFTEKQKDGSTDLYSIADMKGIRNDNSFDKLYKSGKFGAIPNLGSLFLEIDNEN